MVITAFSTSPAPGKGGLITTDVERTPKCYRHSPSNRTALRSTKAILLGWKIQHGRKSSHHNHRQRPYKSPPTSTIPDRPRLLFWTMGYRTTQLVALPFLHTTKPLRVWRFMCLHLKSDKPCKDSNPRQHVPRMSHPKETSPAPFHTLNVC